MALEEVTHQSGAFESCRVHTDAEVDPMSEADVTGKRSICDEAFWLVELALVAVRRLQEEQEPLSSTDRDAGDREVPERRASHELQHAFQANHLLERAPCQRRMRAHGRPFGRVPSELQDA